jgi:hypothetical protein
MHHPRRESAAGPDRRPLKRAEAERVTPFGLCFSATLPARKRGKKLRCQVEKLEPQPQVVVALGLRITNCAPSRPSL